MAELPFNISYKAIWNGMSSICFKACPNKNKELQSLIGVTDSIDTYFILLSLIFVQVAVI